MQNRKAVTLIEMIVILLVIVFVICLFLFITPEFRERPRNLYCGTNLRGMSNALNVYAFDYRDEFPIAGNKGAGQWAASTDNWDDPVVKDRDNLTVAASLYLLVREADVGVKSFLCPMSNQTQFVNETGYDMFELWDFGPKPQDHQSYSYQLPYKNDTVPELWFPADGTSAPGNAIMADKSPWFDASLTRGPGTADNWKGNVDHINPADSAPKWQYQRGNSAPHEREGQNVLFADGHVSFEKRPDVGTMHDNIYTQQHGENPFNVGTGKTGVGMTVPLNKEDTLLVNDEACKKKQKGLKDEKPKSNDTD